MFKLSKKTNYSELYNKYSKYTMVPKEQFIDNLELISFHKKKYKSGNYVECEVWKGGISAATSEELGNKYNFHLFDSFKGLPKVGDKDGVWAKKWQEGDNPWFAENCLAEESYAIDAMKRANCKNFKIYKGWFNKTLNDYPYDEINILRLDADWYDSTMEVLETFYYKVVKGGLIIIDDFYTWEGCIRAVYDFFSKNQISDRIRSTHNDVCYIIKDEDFPFQKTFQKG